MLLTELCQARGIAGMEAEVRTLLRQHLADSVDSVTTDALGNLICYKDGLGPGAEFKVMVAAHMDEVGFMVTHVESSGLLAFEPVGGIDARLIPSRRVRVGRDALPGVIGVRHFHLEPSETRGKVLDRTKLLIDIGARDAQEAEQHVAPGDMVTFDAEPEAWGEHLFSARALDDRVGCAILADVLAGGAFPFTLVGVFTVQEEIGLRGARVAASRVAPDLGLALEGTTCADIPDNPPHGRATVMGGGAAISLMDRSSISNRAIIDELVRLAETNDIPYQFRTTAFGGNDAGPMNLAGRGAPTAVLSVPCRYIHAPVSLCSLRDLDATRTLLGLFLDSVGEGFRP